MRYLLFITIIFLVAAAVSADMIELYSGEIIRGVASPEGPVSTKMVITNESESTEKGIIRIVYNFRIKRNIPGNAYDDYLVKKAKCTTAKDLLGCIAAIGNETINIFSDGVRASAAIK